MKTESINHLAAMLRTQIDSMRRTGKPQQGQGNTLKKEPVQARNRQSTAKQDVASLIMQRAAEIASDDVHRRRKTFRVFLESVLLGELGEGLVADPRFFRMVDDIQHQMEADGELAPVIAQAVDLLLAPGK
ncbi:hypothetical protein [Undibacterium sp. TS12]|uniref:hypothetical protein n=1 Tax=Undibacterium sp. TS12 TaxID=2908202 RepID=UPI001F4CDF32|nr:hypothetical protein [Undibacterium sp. TS12]MCH8620260.1 hypothetical protein [Undibacterium sp. TS12]